MNRWKFGNFLVVFSWIWVALIFLTPILGFLYPLITFGVDLHWLISFFIGSIVGGLGLWLRGDFKFLP